MLQEYLNVHVVCIVFSVYLYMYSMCFTYTSNCFLVEACVAICMTLYINCANILRASR